MIKNFKKYSKLLILTVDLADKEMNLKKKN